MRIEGVNPEDTDDYARRVLEAQAKKWGAPLTNHLVLARRPTIFRGARAMWQGLAEVIAWENASSKFNRALRIPSQGLWKRD